MCADEVTNLLVALLDGTSEIWQIIPDSNPVEQQNLWSVLVPAGTFKSRS